MPVTACLKWVLRGRLGQIVDLLICSAYILIGQKNHPNISHKMIFLHIDTSVSCIVFIIYHEVFLH